MLISMPTTMLAPDDWILEPIREGKLFLTPDFVEYIEKFFVISPLLIV